MKYKVSEAFIQELRDTVIDDELDEAPVGIKFGKATMSFDYKNKAKDHLLFLVSVGKDETAHIIVSKDSLFTDFFEDVDE